MALDWNWGDNAGHLPITTGCGDNFWNSPCTLSWGYAPELRRYLVDILGFQYSVIHVTRDEEFPASSRFKAISIHTGVKIEGGDVVFHGDDSEPTNIPPW